ARPLDAEELTKAKDGLTLTLPGRWETNRAIAASLAQMVQFDLPDDYFTTYPAAVTALDLAAVNAAGKAAIDPARVVYVVVGDRTQIEAGLRELDLGELHLLDADGNPVTAP
ncbi:MAG TPA: insulinase family protein, partial [Thermoanaerobaculia bacterium]|nr:insulinase family protein [Thermoanaerobaculia bacterium]